MTEPIVWVSGEDPEMAQAIKAAQASYHMFAAEMALESRRIIPALLGATVKAFFPRAEPPGGGEHMWLHVTQADERGVSGELASEPQFVTGFVEGQEVSVPRERVSDWILFFGLNQRVVAPPVRGGFTLGVIWKRMSGEERAGSATEEPICWFLESGTPFGSTY
jgi:uncharacterized protein YegJ (DUF2314 family)